MKRTTPKGSYSDYGDYGLSAEEIAALEGCTASRIRTIITVALNKLRRECQKRGLKPENLFGQPLGE